MRCWVSIAKVLLASILLIPLFGFGEFVFSNKDYSKNLDIEWYLVPKELVCPIFNRTDPELLKKRVHLKVGMIDKATKRTLERGYEGEAYLIIRVVNVQGTTAWGDLNCKLKIEGEYDFDLKITHFCGEHTFVYPLTVHLHTDPVVKFHWKHLYTKG